MSTNIPIDGHELQRLQKAGAVFWQCSCGFYLSFDFPEDIKWEVADVYEYIIPDYISHVERVRKALANKK